MEPQKKPIHLNENDTPYLYEPFRNQMPAKRPHPAEKEKILKPVSYTHLDVYKRQVPGRIGIFI